MVASHTRCHLALQPARARARTSPAHTTLTSAWQGTYYFKPKRADDRGENEQRMLELFLVRG